MKIQNALIVILSTLSAAAASAMPSDDVPAIVQSIVDLDFEECDNSISGVRTFCSKGSHGQVSVVAITDKGSISGTIYDADGNVYDVINDANGEVKLTPIDKSKIGKCGLADEEPEIFRAPTIKAYEYPSDSYTEIYDEDMNRNTGRVYVYRVALPVSYQTFKSYPGYGDVDRIHAFWAQAEASFNSTFGKQLSLRLEVVNDDDLIVTDSTSTWPGGTTANYCCRIGTSAISDLIDPSKFDVGIVITQISSEELGLAALAGAYTYSLRANAVAEPYVSTILHEIGHLFGSNHTGNTASGYRTEPGEGTSIMSYGYQRNEFSFISAYRIRHCLAMNSYYSDEARTTLVENEANVNNYNNFVYAIQTDNRPPVLNTQNLKHSYTITKGSLFQFNIDATDPDGDELKYNAMQADISYSTGGFSSNPKVAYQDETTNPCVKFQPKWTLSSSNAWSLKEYTDVRTLATGAYRFWLQANDGKDDINHGTGYAAYETIVNVVNGTAFEMTGTYNTSYNSGDKVTLTWNVDENLYGADSRVRILLSDDFGTTWKYVLCESAPNNGKAEVTLPRVNIGKVLYGDVADNKQVRAGVIKVEVIDDIAYAVTALQPFLASTSGWSSGYDMTGGFTLNVTSGVDEMAAPEKADDRTFDLNGRRVENPTPGNIYIRNGKKSYLGND